MNRTGLIKSGWLVLSLLAVTTCADVARAQDQGVEATTASGEKVKLFSNGRWEFVNQQKAAVQRQAVEVELERERSGQGFLGRRIYEGDKDYNRGSLNPKLR